MKYPFWHWSRLYIVAGSAILMVCALLCGGVFAQKTASDQKPGSISGHIYRADTGQPIPKVILMLSPVNEDSLDDQFAKTDSTGGFIFTGVEPGKYNLRAEHSGFITAEYDDEGQEGEGKIIILVSEQALEKIDLRVEPQGVISGTVVDEDNNPVKGLQVYPVRPQYMAGGAKTVDTDEAMSAMTDDLGHYRLSGLEAGSYYVRVSGDSEGFHLPGSMGHSAKYGQTYYPRAFSIQEAQQIQVDPGVEVSEMNIMVTAQFLTYTISGTLSNPMANSGLRAVVQILRVGTDSSESSVPLESTSVKADGSFAIEGVPPGDYLLRAFQSQIITGKGPSQSSFARLASNGVLIHVQNADLKANLEIEVPGEMRGKVVLENGALAETMKMESVVLVSSEANDIENQSASFPIRTDDGGGFDTKYVSPGRYNFEVFAQGTDPYYLKEVQCSNEDFTMRPINVETGSVTSNCVLTLAKDTGTITGQVLDGDKPVRRYEVIAIPVSPNLRRNPRYTMVAAPRTESSGQFKIVDLIPGDYLLFAVPSDRKRGYFAVDFADRNASSGERVTVKPSETKTINLKPTANPQ